MTPNELNKSITFLLNDLLTDTGFSKKRIGRLIRKEGDCQQFFSFYFSRRQFTDCYDLTSTLIFSFPEVDRLTCQFLGKEYDKLSHTGSKPFYTVVPGQPISKYKYFSDGPLGQFAEMVAKDFKDYGLPFYEKFSTLNKLETYFDRLLREGLRMEFSAQTGKQGSGCCIAATFCLLEQWDKLPFLLKDTSLLLDEHKERISEYISRH